MWTVLLSSAALTPLTNSFEDLKNKSKHQQNLNNGANVNCENQLPFLIWILVPK